ncbi:MAG: hypothetical protein PV362_13695 [Providencia heimbachae]|nr:hypothetical protein [Providencia heimbachae]
MNELKDIYDILNDKYNEQRKVALEITSACKWLSPLAKKEVAEILSGDSKKVQEWVEVYKANFFDNKSHISKNAVSEIRLREYMMMFRASGEGLNHYTKALFLWVGINKSWSEFCWNFDKKAAVEALVVAICRLAKLGSIEGYRELLKTERELRLKRKSASAKGGNSVAELTAVFRCEAIRLFNRDKSNGTTWKNYKKAVEAIEDELWQFIELKRDEGHSTLLKRETLNDAVLRWADKDKDVKSALESIVKRKSKT